MAQVEINVPMDKNLAKQFEDVCSEIGMNTNTAINFFAKTAVRERRIPFKIKTRN